MRKPATIAELLLYAVEKYENKDFCRYIRDDELCKKTYREFYNDCISLCNYICSISNEKKHIGFIGKTNYEYIVALTGMILSGHVVIPFAPDITTEEAVLLFGDADVTVLFCEQEFLSKAKDIQNNYPALKSVISLGDAQWFQNIFEAYGSSSQIADNDPDACALIIYTSGTTGNRKGVMLSNRNLAHNSTYDTYCMEDDDVSFSILPMHHVFCYACDVLKTIYDGGVLCLNESLADLYKNFLLFEPTIMRIVPAVCRSVLTRIKIAERRNPNLTKREAAETVVGKNFKRMIAGSAYLSVYMIDEFEKYGIIARQGYGMSECSPRITTSDFSEVCKYSNGILLGTDSVRCVDGEIQVKGPSVMLGYYKKPEDTAAAFTEDGFLLTGDLGYIENGHVYLIGRQKNLIILSNGENISPEEIENRFADDEVIKEIVVFAESDRIVAEIYPDAHFLKSDDLQNEIGAIVDRVNMTMPSDRQIDEFRLRNIPFERTSSGKIKRTQFIYRKDEMK